VGLLGTDVLWDWSIDFRKDPPRLVRGIVADEGPGRIRETLYQDGGRYTVRVASGEADSLPHRAVVDTGSPYPLLLFQSRPPEDVPVLANPRSPLTANGTATSFFSLPNFQIGAAAPGTTVGLVGEVAGPSVFLVGTPALMARHAVLHLGNWTWTQDQSPTSSLPSSESPEAWSWRATLVPGKGIHVDALLPGSLLEIGGVTAGSWVRQVNGQAVDLPRSWLEWTRVWKDLAQGRVDVRS
jgi:hypothetical protein